MNWFRDIFKNFRLTGSQENQSLEQKIEQRAYELWEQGGKLENTLNYYREKARQQVKHNLWKKHYNPYYLLEKKILEPGLTWIDKQAFFDILGRLGNLAIVIGVISFIFTEDYRRNAEIFSAWQTITSAEGQSGSGGRIEALHFLNSRPLRLPLIGFTKEYWYWDKWSNECKKTWRLGYRFPRQSLSGLSAPKAYLRAINLCDADLSGASLQEANLQDVYLLGANLQDAYLGGANLQNASLQDANLSKAIYTDKESSFIWQHRSSDGKVSASGVFPKGARITIFPDDFDSKKAGMILIRTKEDYDKWLESRQK
ncbi:MAG: pentapeptide repeat-containing protein [Crocosphaera sp.]